jgi:hypothetical protein
MPHSQRPLLEKSYNSSLGYSTCCRPVIDEISQLTTGNFEKFAAFVFFQVWISLAELAWSYLQFLRNFADGINTASKTFSETGQECLNFKQRRRDMGE